MHAAGKRRVYCFDRSGFYSKSMSALKRRLSLNALTLIEIKRSR